MQDFLNNKFGKWTVISYDGKNKERHWYNVQCDCGNKSLVERNILKQGKSTKCRSCARKKNQIDNGNPMKTHGFSSPSHPYFRVYTAWCTMKSRCNNTNDRNYKRYGGKGIKVCDRWFESFENFLEDMKLPDVGNSLDRINVYGNYCKENCRWANREVQANNCRRTIYHEYKNEKLSETQWSRKLGISRNKVMYWARKNGIKWLIENLESVKKAKKGMTDNEYLDLGFKLPEKLYRKF